MKKIDLVWLAGLLEGEGSFQKAPPSEPNRIRISLSMTDLDVIQRVCTLWDVSYINDSKNWRKRGDWKVSYVVKLRGAKAASMMKRLHPFMGKRRKSQIDAALADFNPRQFLRAA